MINKIIHYLYDLRDIPRISLALSKAAATINNRQIDLKRPFTWEFSGFSQNGEDGIIEVLRKQLKSCNRYFIEIGASDGIENNTAWLVVAEKYNGLMIEGNKSLAARADRVVKRYSIGAECKNLFVTRENISGLQSVAMHKDPDLFSLDIDGNDYYIAKAILEGGFKPKIFVVEYNSAYGPEECITVEYRDDFIFTTAHTTKLYYGVSIAAWKKLFNAHGYQFITVDQHGVNAFFVDPNCFDSNFLSNIEGISFVENQYQFTKFRSSWADQFKLIANQKFVKT
ncbi:MAG: hypothetical protein V4545_11475 [Pseudomonadota bacterium]